jgi:hypothetical protein
MVCLPSAAVEKESGAISSPTRLAEERESVAAVEARTGMDDNGS